MPKTGTTSIQSFFSTFQQEIFKEYNLYYPSFGKATPGSKNNPMHRALFCRNENSETWKDVQNEVSQVGKCNILFSEEDISLMLNRDALPKALSALRLYFPAYNIKIIVFLRRVDEYIKSRYRQDSKTLNGLDYCEYLQRNISNPRSLLYTSNLIQECHAAVGKENTLIGLYSNSPQYDAVHSFFELLSLPAPDFYSSKLHENPSFPLKALPFTKKFLHPAELDNDVKKWAKHTLEKVFRNPKTPQDFKQVYADIAKTIDLVPSYATLLNSTAISFEFSEEAKPEFVLMYSMLLKISSQISELHNEVQELKQGNAKADK